MVKKRFCQPGAFTLLELLVVITLLALLASMVVTRMGGRGLVRLQQAEETLLATDAWARQLAQQQGRSVQLRIDLTTGTFRVEDKEAREDPIVRQRGCPSGITIRRALTTLEERSRGTLVVHYNRHGASDSCAVKLETDNGWARWVLLAGGSGRPFVFDTGNSSPRGKDEPNLRDRDVEDFFHTLRKKSFTTRRKTVGYYDLFGPLETS